MQLTSPLPPVEPVRFLKELEDTTFRLGQPLSLYCAYSASPKVYVSWRKDNKPVWASYKYNVKTTDNSCVLEVLNSDRLEAAGRYSCEISNSENTAICYAQVKLGKTLNMKGHSKGSFVLVFIVSNIVVFKNGNQKNLPSSLFISSGRFVWPPLIQSDFHPKWIEVYFRSMWPNEFEFLLGP